jgi:hypothetical protein
MAAVVLSMGSVVLVEDHDVAEQQRLLAAITRVTEQRILVVNLSAAEDAHDAIQVMSCLQVGDL